jgi:glycerophosphoryl diester phosphodiesterase
LPAHWLRKFNNTKGHRCVVSSFNRDALLAIRPLLPRTPVGVDC